LVLALPLVVGACSFSYKLDSLFPSDKEAGSEPTGTMPAALPNAGRALAELSDADLALAKAAASEAVTRTGRDVSVPWENPTTGARGTVTPLAAAFRQNGSTCREFLTSYVREADERWLEGEACQLDEGRWEVRNLKPWKRS
jgi:surface antigen